MNDRLIHKLKKIKVGKMSKGLFWVSMKLRNILESIRVTFNKDILEGQIKLFRKINIKAKVEKEKWICI